MLISWRFGIASALIASTGAFSQGLALDSLVRMGMRANPDLLLSREEGEGVAADTLISAYPPNPHLELDAGYNLTQPDRPRGGARISREYQPGVRKGQYRVSRTHLKARRQWQKAKELETILDIRSAYFTWQTLNRKARLQQEVQKRWESLSRIAAAKVKEGRLSQVDETQARLNLAKARQREMELKTEMTSMEKRLAYLTGHGYASLPDSLAPARTDLSPTLPSLESLVSMAMQESPELKALDMERAAQQDQESLERAVGKPTMTFSLGYERETEGDNVVAGGVELPLPLFNRNQAGITKARSALKVAEKRRATAEQGLKAEISEIHGRLGNLADRYRNYQSEISALGLKQLELSEKGFLQGMLGIFDLSRVQEEFLSQEGEALDILEEYYRQWNRLGKAVGGRIW